MQLALGFWHIAASAREIRMLAIASEIIDLSAGRIANPAIFARRRPAFIHVDFAVFAHQTRRTEAVETLCGVAAIAALIAAGVGAVINVELTSIPLEAECAEASRRHSVLRGHARGAVETRA